MKKLIIQGASVEKTRFDWYNVHHSYQNNSVFTESPLWKRCICHGFRTHISSVSTHKHAEENPKINHPPLYSGHPNSQLKLSGWSFRHKHFTSNTVTSSDPLCLFLVFKCPLIIHYTESTHSLAVAMWQVLMRHVFNNAFRAQVTLLRNFWSHTLRCTLRPACDNTICSSFSSSLLIALPFHARWHVLNGIFSH